MAIGAEPDSSVVDLEFRLTADRYPFVRVSAAESCRFELLRLLPRGEDRYGEFFAVTGADPDAVRDRLEQDDLVEPRLHARRDDSGLFELAVTEECPVADLAVREAIPKTVTSEDGTARIEACIVPPPDPATVVDRYQDAYPDASLVEISDSERPVPLFSDHELALTLEKRLTDRQVEVLSRAYEAGYYERPRETTGEELADELDISVATLSQHIRVAERHLLSILFENEVL